MKPKNSIVWYHSYVHWGEIKLLQFQSHVSVQMRSAFQTDNLLCIPSYKLSLNFKTANEAYSSFKTALIYFAYHTDNQHIGTIV